MLPFIEQQALYNAFNASIGMEGVETATGIPIGFIVNSTIATTRIASFQCPSDITQTFAPGRLGGRRRLARHSLDVVYQGKLWHQLGQHRFRPGRSRWRRFLPQRPLPGVSVRHQFFGNGSRVRQFRLDNRRDEQYTIRVGAPPGGIRRHPRDHLERHARRRLVHDTVHAKRKPGLCSAE